MSENVRDIRCKGCIWEPSESGCNVVYSHERCVTNRKFVEVEDFDKKKEAFEEGLKRIARCQEIFGKATTISLILGDADVPVNLIKIDGIIEIDKLNTIYKILMGLDKDEDKDENEVDYEELELEEMLEDEERDKEQLELKKIKEDYLKKYRQYAENHDVLNLEKIKQDYLEKYRQYVEKQIEKYGYF